jgi:hypothetical protein
MFNIRVEFRIKGEERPAGIWQTFLFKQQKKK